MTASSKRVVLFSDPDHEPDNGNPMEFRLTYSDLLFSTGNDSRLKGDKRADHKHKIRARFHPQLQRLWEITPFLKTGKSKGSGALFSDQSIAIYKASYLAKKHSHFGWHFVPLVTKELDLICGIDILFLRPQHPGAVVRSGDIDGRLKTLLDALSIPDANQAYESRTPGKGENPMYVLLENDQLITKVSVETDQLLELVTPEYDVNQARLVITGKLRPYELHVGNMQFG